MNPISPDAGADLAANLARSLDRDVAAVGRKPLLEIFGEAHAVGRRD